MSIALLYERSEADEVGILPAKAEGENVALPHLVGSGPLKEARPWRITPGLAFGLLDEFFFVQGLAHCFGACLEKKDSLQRVGNSPHTKERVLLL